MKRTGILQAVIIAVISIALTSCFSTRTSPEVIYVERVPGYYDDYGYYGNSYPVIVDERYGSSGRYYRGSRDNRYYRNNNRDNTRSREEMERYRQQQRERAAEQSRQNQENFRKSKESIFGKKQ